MIQIRKPLNTTIYTRDIGVHKFKLIALFECYVFIYVGNVSSVSVPAQLSCWPRDFYETSVRGVLFWVTLYSATRQRVVISWCLLRSRMRQFN